ncbi:hypothetical protein C8R43DRAFT_955660 [Mycena crocata]|nr:hypothetical protein C8R43DRAFT_955660 [Mycena crocata]
MGSDRGPNVSQPERRVWKLRAGVDDRRTEAPSDLSNNSKIPSDQITHPLTSNNIPILGEENRKDGGESHERWQLERRFYDFVMGDESSPPNLDPSPSQHGSGSISLELLDPVYSSNRLSVQLEPNGPLDLKCLTRAEWTTRSQVFNSSRMDHSLSTVQLEPNGPLDLRLTQCSENSLVPKVSMKQKKKRRGRHTQSIHRSNLISNCSVNTTGIKSTVQLDMDRKHTGKAESRIPGGK